MELAPPPKGNKQEVSDTGGGADLEIETFQLSFSILIRYLYRGEVMDKSGTYGKMNYSLATYSHESSSRRSTKRRASRMDGKGRRRSAAKREDSDAALPRAEVLFLRDGSVPSGLVEQSLTSNGFLVTVVSDPDQLKEELLLGRSHLNPVKVKFPRIMLLLPYDHLELHL